MKKTSFMAVCTLLIVLANPLFAQHMFLSAGTFTTKGSIYRNFENYVEISSVQYGVDAETSYNLGGGAAVGRPTFREMVVTKNVDILSNELLRRITTGKSIPLIEIVTTQNTDAGEKVAHKIELKDVFVTDVSDAGVEGCTGNCGGLAESVKLVYKAIRITTYSINPVNGQIQANPNPFIYNVVDRVAEF